METIQYHHHHHVNHMNSTANANNCLNTSNSSSSNDNDSLNNNNSNCSSSSSSCSSMNGIGSVNGNVNGCINTNGTNLSISNSISEQELNASFNDFISKTNLIVNYLPQNMTQDEIKELFSSIGPLESCKLVKDKVTAQSLGYAFVNYLKPDDASKAINKLNGMHLQNKTIKVSYARPSSESIKGANLYICGLHLDVTQAQLENMFTPYGTIISSKILTDPKTGVSKGVGFVRFDQRIEAEVAIDKLNGYLPEGYTEPLIVKFANTPATAKAVIGLPLAPFVPTCRGFYQPYRSTTTASYRYSPISTYCAPDTTSLQIHQAPAPAPLQVASNISLAGLLTAPITAASITTTTPSPTLSNPSLNSTVAYSGWCIFVYNLGPETDENTLWQLFGPFGAVQSVKIVRDAQLQKCKGFGFVTMTNYAEAAAAIEQLNGCNLGNRILQVSFKTNTAKQYY